MSLRDQQKYMEALRRFQGKLDKNETEEYKMFVKRHKDEEEFDSVSMRRLKELYDKYNVPVDKHKYDAFFKTNNGNER
jgi:hypothetical protein